MPPSSCVAGVETTVCGGHGIPRRISDGTCVTATTTTATGLSDEDYRRSDDTCGPPGLACAGNERRIAAASPVWRRLCVTGTPESGDDSEAVCNGDRRRLRRLCLTKTIVIDDTCFLPGATARKRTPDSSCVAGVETACVWRDTGIGR